MQKMPGYIQEGLPPWVRWYSIQAQQRPYRSQSVALQLQSSLLTSRLGQSSLGLTIYNHLPGFLLFFYKVNILLIILAS